MPNANSSTVDERIVEMRINNQKFEAGAKKTLDTLEKLDDSLNALGKNKTSGFGGIERAFTGITSAFNGLSGIADNVFGKLSSKVQALAADMEKLVKSLTIDQINAGWDKYAEKTQGVQTIMAATAKDWEDQAAQMEWVNEQLEKLNWFTDETSYNFLDMVNNIGKFTSNGVKLETAVTAMEGISTWAALSGANTQEASRAMYNLSQALATGSVKLIDWKSIENANMATREFKETALETAADLKQLVKVGDGVWRTLSGKEFTTEQFNTQLSEGWFSSEVLLQTLQQYGDFTDALQAATEASDLTASEFLSAMEAYKENDMETFNKYVAKSTLSVGELIPLIETLNGDQYELGRRAFKAAQEAKTFKEAIAATKDAVSTGWMNVFEKMFGNYLQAKEFWTEVAESLYNIFAEPVNGLNELVNVAFGDMGPALTTGRELFTEGLLNILHIIEAVGSGIESIVAKVVGIFDEQGNSLHLEHFGEVLYYLIERFNRLTKAALNFVDEIMDPLTTIIAGLINIIKPAFSMIGTAVRLILSAGSSILTIIRDLYSRLSENGAILVFLNAFYDIFYALTFPLQIVATYIRNFFNSLRTLASNIGNAAWAQTLADWLLIIGAYFADLAARFRNFMESGAFLTSLISIFNGLKTAVALAFGVIIGLFDKIRNAFQAGGILGVLQAIGNKIRELVRNNPLLLRGFEILKTVLGAVVGLIFVAISSIGSLFTKFDFSKLKIKLPFIDKIRGFFEQIKDVLKLKFSGIISWFESFKHFEIFGRLSEKIKTVFDSIKNFFSGLRPDFSGFTAFFGSIKEFFSNAFENLFSDTEKIKIAISNFVHAVFQFLGESLKNVSLKDIIDALKIGLILSKIGRVFTFISFLTKMKKELTGIPEAISGMFEELGGMFKNIGKSFQGRFYIQIAVAIGLIAAAIYALSTIEENSLMRAAAVVALIGIVLTRMSEVIFGKKIYNKTVDIKKFQLVSDMAGVLIGIAMVIGALGVAIGKIGGLALKDPKAMWSAFGIIAVLIAEIGVLMLLIARSFSNIKSYNKIDAIGDAMLRVSETMALMAIAIRLLVKPLLNIASMMHKYQDESVGEAGRLIFDFALMFGLFAAGLVYMLGNMKDMTTAKIDSIGTTMLKVAASMAIMAVAIRILMKPLLNIASIIHRYKGDGSIGKAALIISGFAVVLGGIIAALTLLLQKTSGRAHAKIERIGNTILKMAAAMAIIAVAVRILVNPLVAIAAAISKFGGWKMLGALVIMAAIMAALATVTTITAKKADPKQLLMVGAGMALFAVGLAILLPALITFISLTSGILGIVSGLKNFWSILGKLGALSAVVLIFGAAITLFGVGVLAVGVGLLTASASLLLFAAGIYVLVAALDKIGPAMKSFVTGMIEAGAMITKDNLLDFGKAILVLLALAAAVWLLGKAFGALDITKVTSFFSNIGTLAGSLIKGVSSIFGKLGEAIIAHLPKIQTIIVSLITIIGLFAVGAMRPLINMIGSALISLIANIYLYIHNNRKVIEYYIFNLIAEIMNMVNDALTWAISMIIPSIVQLIGGAISDLIRSIPIKGDEWADAFEKKLAESNFMPNSDAMQEKLQRSFGRNENFWQSVNPFGDIPPEVHEVTEEQAAALGIDYVGGLESAKETIVTELTGFKEELSSGVGDAFSVDSGESSPVAEGATSMADIGIDSLLGELGLRDGDISDAGFNVGSGLAGGMLDSSSLVSGAAGQLADIVPETIRSHLEIKSPSRVLAALAAFIPSGVAKGITDNISDVDDSMMILGSAVLAAMQAAMARVATVADENFEFTPTITPVVDLSNVSTAAGSAGAIFGGVSATMRGSLRIASDNASASMAALQINDGSDAVVSELQFLSDKVDKLGDAVSNMKIVLDTGLLVGATSGKMNTALGIAQMRSERGN